MHAFIIHRLAQGALVLLMALTAAFLLMYVIGDPVIAIVGAEADRATIENVRQLYGLDRPLYVQYFSFLTNALQGDFGMSARYRTEVFPLMLQRLVVSIEIALPALVLAICLSILLGVVSAAYRNKLPDYLARIVALVGQAAPIFWVAIMLIVIFSLALNWLPASGRGTWQHMVLPTITLALWPTAYLTRIMRGSILDVLGSDFIRTARGKGLAPMAVLFRHALRNALIPFTTVSAMQFATLLAGSMIVETIFNYPGLGLLMINAIRQLDISLVAGSIALTASIAVVMNLVADILYAVIDPRVSR
ncbi:ABC transporter permease [Pelagibacterium montanilacus]|uniref:ABC transporter permease n=1 Tax=Pelagibacterium montanilacus TaxID=2185280 RepID=UPI000F8F26EF|nr:ABC transporter permease [Pelagibacterium montanilacus]